MRRRPPFVVIAVASVAVLAVPAQAEFSPNLVNQPVYFTCTATEKVNNLDGPAGWSTTAPAGSYTAGEGCGQADSGAEVGADHDAEFAGTFTGNLDELTVRLHNIDTSPFGRMWGETTVDVTLLIDGVPTLSGRQVLLNATPSETNITFLYDFTVENIGFVAEEHNVEHTVELIVAASTFDVQANWVYDAAEIPSGIVFNPTADQRAAVRVKAEVKPPVAR